MTDKEKIKAEIESRLKIKDRGYSTEYAEYAYRDALEDILRFIDSLLEEPASEDLEKAAEQFLKVLSLTPYNNTPITDAQMVTKELLVFLRNTNEYNPFQPASEDLEEELTKHYNTEAEQNSAWSEEDEKFFNTALWHISYSVSNGKSTDCRCATTEWLKSLKDRYTWKPSDKQLGALNYVVNLMASSKSSKENDYYYNIFKDLREQLKKLKEE